MASYDISKFSERAGKLYYKDKRASKGALKFFNQYSKGGSSRLQVSKEVASKFNKGLKFNSRSGHVKETYRALTLKQTEKGGVIGARRVGKYNFSKPSKALSTSSKWGSNLDGGHTTNLRGFEGWIEHLAIAIHAVSLQAEYFRMAAGQRAMQIFQKSFSYQKFYTANSSKWADLAPYTKRKREKRHTSGKILHEYGDLQESIKINETDGIYTTIYTDIVKADIKKHKKLTNCYAGFHNEGEGTYGVSNKRHVARPYIKRQFMGHSSYLNPITDPWMSKMTKRYLFDSVFLSKSSK